MPSESGNAMNPIPKPFQANHLVFPFAAAAFATANQSRFHTIADSLKWPLLLHLQTLFSSKQGPSKPCQCRIFSHTLLKTPLLSSENKSPAGFQLQKWGFPPKQKKWNCPPQRF